MAAGPAPSTPSSTPILPATSQHRPSNSELDRDTAPASFGEIGMGLLRAVRPWTQWIAGWGFDIRQGANRIRARHRFREKDRGPDWRSRRGDRHRQDIHLVCEPGISQTQYSKGPRFFAVATRWHRHPPVERPRRQTLACRMPFNLAWKLAYRREGLCREKIARQLLRGNARRSANRWCCGPISRGLDYAPLNGLFSGGGAADNPVAAGIRRAFHDQADRKASRARRAPARSHGT